MAQNPSNPLHAPVAQQFFVVSASVATSASAIAAGLGPFRGLFFKTSSSVTISQDGNTIVVDDFPKNGILWIQGSFVSAIVTATNVYALR